MFEIGIIFDISKDLYYVKTKTGRYMSKARGIFRKQKFSPMVGDNVKIEIFEDNTACIVEVFERKNEILRPPVVNVDQAIIVFSLKEPEISYKIIDRYIMYYEVMKIPIILCLNKCDLINKETEINFRNIYDKLGYKIIFNSISLDNRKLFEEICKDKISVITGASGVGKSTILNFLNPDYNIWVGDISNKTKRGKHTTRAATLYEFFDNSFIIDTAGFTSLDLTKFIDSEVQIRDAFVEFEFGSKCKFSDCKHINEPDCYVKSKLESGSISKSRYDSYIFYLNEYLKNRRY